MSRCWFGYPNTYYSLNIATWILHKTCELSITIKNDRMCMTSYPGPTFFYMKVHNVWLILEELA